MIDNTEDIIKNIDWNGKIKKPTRTHSQTATSEFW